MDVAGAVIILLFVVTIFSSSVQQGPTSTKTPPSRPPVHSNITNTALPDPYFSAVVGENVEERIKSYILSFNKKVSSWDAGKMAYCMVKYGKEYDVNPKLVAALVCRESAYNRYAVSPTGAQGLGQLIPSTAKGLSVTDSFDIDQNLWGTTRYVRLMLERWDGNSQQVPLALASYAEGYGAVTRNGGYKDATRKYIKGIINYYWQI